MPYLVPVSIANWRGLLRAWWSISINANAKPSRSTFPVVCLSIARRKAMSLSGPITTLSFQCLKPAFLVAENADNTGEVHILDIGLQEGFLAATAGVYESVDISIISSIHKPRKRFAHKGNFGHALLVAGSYGKIGAAILSAKACLRSGIGLLSCHIPKCGIRDRMQTAVPEAMVMTDFNSSFLTKVEDDPTKYESIGIGPGIGTASETKMMLREIFDTYRLPWYSMPMH